MTTEEKQAFTALQQKVTDLEARNQELSEKYNALYENSGVRWAWIDENLPDWALSTIQKLYDDKILQGDEEGSLRLSFEMLRVLVMLDRAGVFGSTWDVSADAASYMKKAGEAGLMDNENPQKMASRAQLAAVATRIMEKLSKEK